MKFPKNAVVNGAEIVYLRGNIARIFGAGGSITGEGMLVLADGSASVLQMERLGRLATAS